MNVDDAKNILKWTRERLHKTFELIPDEFLDFKPDCVIPDGEKFSKTRGILNHIGWVENYWIHEKMAKNPLDKEYWNFRKLGVSEIVKKLDIIREKTNEWLDSLEDSNLDRPYSNRAKKHISWIVYHLAEHEAHHLGQICLLTTFAGVKIIWS